MVFTLKEEEILKLQSALIIAQNKLNAVNLEMGTAIRAQFSTIDAQIRAQYKPQYEPLELEIKNIQTALAEKSV